MNNNRFSLTWIKEREFYDKQSRSNLLTMEIKKDSKNVKKIISMVPVMPEKKLLIYYQELILKLKNI